MILEMKSLLIGESVDSKVQSKIRAAVLEGGEAKSIIHIRTMHLGPEDILIGIKIESNAKNLNEVANGIDAIEKRIRNSVPGALTIYIEPDILKV